jgi:hypothetical protein
MIITTICILLQQVQQALFCSKHKLEYTNPLVYSLIVLVYNVHHITAIATISTHASYCSLRFKISIITVLVSLIIESHYTVSITQYYQTVVASEASLLLSGRA